MWTTATLDEATLAAGGQTIVDMLGGFTLTEKHNISGVITIHYAFYFRANIPNTNVHGRWGIIVVEDDALAVNQVPEPALDGDAPWLINKHYMVESTIDEHRVHEGQVKARRRIAIKQTLAFVVDNDAASDSSLDFAIATRPLLQRGR